MKRFSFFVFSFLLIFLSFSVFAEETRENGEVLYHQNFSAVTDFASSGIKIGTLSSDKFKLICSGDSLEVLSCDTKRTYLILPEFEHSASCTIETEFDFSKINAENGFFGIILNCRGEEPNNITSVLIRANGSADEFEDFPKSLSEKIKNGEKMKIRIPLDDGILSEIEFITEDKTFTVERNSVLKIESGNMGIVIRNVSVQIYDISVVNGTNYIEKTGFFVDKSYSDLTSVNENSPETSDITAIFVFFSAISLFFLLVELRKIKKST